MGKDTFIKAGPVLPGELSRGGFGIDTVNNDAYVSGDGLVAKRLKKGTTDTVEGVEVLSTGEGGGVKVLTEDGAGGASWETPAASGSGDSLLEWMGL